LVLGPFPREGKISRVQTLLNFPLDFLLTRFQGPNSSWNSWWFGFGRFLTIPMAIFGSPDLPSLFNSIIKAFSESFDDGLFSKAFKALIAARWVKLEIFYHCTLLAVYLINFQTGRVECQYPFL